MPIRLQSVFREGSIGFLDIVRWTDCIRIRGVVLGGMSQSVPSKASIRRDVVAFIAKGRPLSTNGDLSARGRAMQVKYGQLYAQAAAGRLSDNPCYAAVYYFVPGYRPKIHPDAGNIHKRLIDGLQGKAFTDDHVVRLVLSGVVDFGETADAPLSIDELDLSHLPRRVLKEFVGLVAAERDFVYVEVGPLGRSMFAFNLGKVVE
jgi:hypothetical protein